MSECKTVEIPAETRTLLEQASKDTGVSISSLVEWCVEDYIKELVHDIKKYYHIVDETQA